ncbi:receptor-activated Ca2+-permeable cation channel [Mycena belliarum]|uniref:Receptor-activated Ca2+-permeable cation channel n=1 Tax=Mycena belliarum TaxID=1033014 RepID=A0AAD6XYB2_9AGAR|nr:receptor-activated Ca2+-permeable cation channel [Mycena belliae]
MDREEQSAALLAPSPEFLATVPVFPLIPAIKKDIVKTIDSALSWDQLTASDINFSIVRPIVLKYAKLTNMAVVYACLVNRAYFLEESENDLAYAGVMLSRATLCEILAMKLLSHFASNHITLVAVLTTSWSPLAGASPEVVEQVKQLLGSNANVNDAQSALEVAISTQAKHFIASPVSQKVVTDIYTGRIVFSTATTRSMLADNYKPRAITIYDCRDAPFLDHYRLRVPKYGAMLEFLNFACLLFTFVLCLSNKNPQQLNFWETVFIVFAAAFALEEYTASNEHGWIIYIANMWNVFDSSFVVIFLCYIVMRIKGLSSGDLATSEMAFDVLSCGACILFPRLAFFAISNNVVVLSLRVMIAEFLFFMAIACCCFSGLLFTLWTLGQGTWSIRGIAWLMVEIWFGNSYLSFQQAESFHPVLGPILMTTFAALSNTLLLTILISILSNTVARIDANATQEHLFQFAISTIEGVQADALFSYQPPFNLVAFAILKPASYLVTPRTLHSMNVLLIKITTLPILVVIGAYERYFADGQSLRESSRDAAHTIFNSLPRQIKNMPLLEALVGSTSSNLYEAIFDVDLGPGADLFNESDDEDFPQLRSVASHDTMTSAAAGVRRRPSRTSLPARSPQRNERSPHESPRLRPLSALDLGVSSAEVSSGGRSPLARFFAHVDPPPPPPPSGHVEASVRRMETMLDDLRELPVHRLKDEMRELQERQARIEQLLLTLTRGMRSSDTSTNRRN